MLLKTVPSPADLPISTTKKTRGKPRLFPVLPKLILPRPQNRTEAEQGIIRAC